MNDNNLKRFLVLTKKKDVSSTQYGPTGDFILGEFDNIDSANDFLKICDINDKTIYVRDVEEDLQ